MSPIQTRAHGALTELRLARPPANALDPALCAALTQALRAAVDQGAEGIVLSGGPKVFSGGLDVPHLLALGEDRAALRSAWETFFAAAAALAECPVPVAAAIDGHAPAGGCVLALCCDYRVMARAPDPAKPYRIGLNEVQVGLVAPEGVQHLLRRVVGAYRAERLLVAGAMPDTDQALAIGLVDEAVPEGDAVARAAAWLDTLRALPRQAMLQTRAIAREDLVAALRPERIRLAHFLDAWYAKDTQAALRALVARLGK
ncbi:enoyl-CoA hydratase/isomerase family protein [Vulcaniibacterium tengchongense]|uniref:Enoyl-CoA hydratase/carnithine racemase n=1 Tax=Vulcaniibacterium tengchongense TaxID=1273429 RepID=A0A3N4V223_9GAMM|nr:enoyl-CoA hydratase/isomerase family protein [Vulcaniibacterium tengchongense]RPE77012.1 enoyl-CoA hydratase/carnithine racemase [Vulcaniibacterium tengchongense]